MSVSGSTPTAGMPEPSGLKELRAGSLRALIQSALRACDRERRNSPDAPTSEFLYRSMDAIYLAVQLETDPSIARKLLTDDKAVFDWFERGRDRFTQKWDRPEIFEVDAESRLEGEAFEAVKADAVGSLHLAQSNELKRCSEIDRAALLISQKKDEELVERWLPFFPYPTNIVTDICRSGARLVTVNNRPVVDKSNSQSLLAWCKVAQGMVEAFPENQRNESLYQAVGSLLTASTMERAPGAIIPIRQSR